ncbi:hypothetical protein Tco_0614716 [Tanacetum coccineum]
MPPNVNSSIASFINLARKSSINHDCRHGCVLRKKEHMISTEWKHSRSMLEPLHEQLFFASSYDAVVSIQILLFWLSIRDLASTASRKPDKMSIRQVKVFVSDTVRRCRSVVGLVIGILSAVTDEVGGIGSVSDIFYEFRKISID